MAKGKMKTVQMVAGNNLTYAGFHFSAVGQTADVTLAQAKHLLKKKVGNKKRFQLYDADFDESAVDEVEDSEVEEVPDKKIIASPMRMDVKSLKAWFKENHPDIEFNAMATLNTMQALIPEIEEEEDPEEVEDGDEIEEFETEE